MSLQREFCLDFSSTTTFRLLSDSSTCMTSIRRGTILMSNVFATHISKRVKSKIRVLIYLGIYSLISNANWASINSNNNKPNTCLVQIMGLRLQIINIKDSQLIIFKAAVPLNNIRDMFLKLSVTKELEMAHSKI
jgi:hypothetical protein